PPVAGGELLRLAARPAAPDRPDGVDHVPRRQPSRAGDLRIARLAATQVATLGEQLGPGGAVDRAVDAPAAEQRRVGGVDDRVRLGVLRDVAAMERDLRHRGRRVYAYPGRMG